MKIGTLIAMATLCTTAAFAQPKDVTKKYIENPGFEARFAAWVNPGSFTYNVASTFDKRDGQVWLEKWVAKGSTLGNNDGIYQTLRNLPTGDYTLTVAAKNINQSSASKVCGGAFLFAGNQQTEIKTEDDYSVNFTVVNGKADIGVRLKSCSGNWVCIDNFRLTYNGENAENIAAEQERLNAEEAALREKMENATHTSLKVTTYPFVPTGNTIALGRSTISGTHKEEGFCWSTNPEPTIFDDKTTEVFDNNGKIYVMRGLTPATPYYVRAYAMTSGGYVVYGNEVKIVTLPAGNMSYGFFNDNNGDAETCARINSASAECIWMYNQLSYIPGFYLSVHYVPGAGAGGGTADCSYGGWMRVSQNVPYQQTGTMLHETNHGVGVGTTGEWYNNANLRADVSRGLWLGPMGTKMVRFFENSTTATMTGDGTHMWPYGINGANEDRYQPSNHCLYFANILITHALHQDGLPSTNGVGFASPAYVFEQRDTTKYYIKSNDPETGMLTGYLYATASSLKWNAISAKEAKANDDYAWYIKYDPKTRYYYFQNVGNGKTITYSTGFKVTKVSTPTDNEKMHLMPARIDTKIGSGKNTFTKTAYWVMLPNKYSSQAMEATTANGVKGSNIDLSNGATRQQWIFLTDSEMEALETASMNEAVKQFQTSLEQARKIVAVPHTSSSEENLVEDIDAQFNNKLDELAARLDSIESPSEIVAMQDETLQAILDFIAQVKPADSGTPFDLTFMLNNPNFDQDASGWSEAAAWNNSCCEFYQKNFDFNQTTSSKMPKGTYELRVQAFQRPGSIDNIKTDYYEAGKNNVNTEIYIKTKTTKVKNIAVDAQKTETTGTKLVTTVDGVKQYIPNDMASAQAYFKKGLYENSVFTTTSSVATIKVGIKSNGNSNSGYWTIFDNFRLYYYGSLSNEDITPVTDIHTKTPSQIIYDLQGRKVKDAEKGLYIINGKKVIK